MSTWSLVIPRFADQWKGSIPNPREWGGPEAGMGEVKVCHTHATQEPDACITPTFSEPKDLTADYSECILFSWTF